MTTLHVFYDGDNESVVAESIDDAWAVYLANINGDSGKERREDYPGIEWMQMPDEHKMTIYEDEERTRKVTKTCSQWAADNGRGWLCCEYS